MAAYSFAVVDEALLCHGLFAQLRVAEGLAIAGVPAQLAAAYLRLDVPFAFDRARRTGVSDTAGQDPPRVAGRGHARSLGPLRHRSAGPWPGTLRDEPEAGHGIRRAIGGTRRSEFRLSLVSGASNRCRPRPPAMPQSETASGSTAVWLTPLCRGA